MKRRIMIIGASGCGKTTLANQLSAQAIPVKNTQDIIYRDRVIDVPGNFIQSPYMWGHLISLAQDHAACILMLTEQGTSDDVYSPGFAKTFNCPVIGVITKCGLTSEPSPSCFKQLKRAGIHEPYYRISIYEESEILELKERLKGICR